MGDTRVQILSQKVPNQPGVTGHLVSGECKDAVERAAGAIAADPRYEKVQYSGVKRGNDRMYYAALYTQVHFILVHDSDAAEGCDE